MLGVDRIRERLSDLCTEFGACAAGYWTLEASPGRLAQVAFAGGAGLDPTVGAAFATATLQVPLDQPDLGIVWAATSGRTTVSESASLAPDSGSGHWLRAFGASRSVAVPIRDDAGAVRAVCSVAVREGRAGDERSIVQRIRKTFEGQASGT